MCVLNQRKKKRTVFCFSQVPHSAQLYSLFSVLTHTYGLNKPIHAAFLKSFSSRNRSVALDTRLNKPILAASLNSCCLGVENKLIKELSSSVGWTTCCRAPNKNWFELDHVFQSRSSRLGLVQCLGILQLHHGDGPGSKFLIWDFPSRIQMVSDF
jgi:hypothetical protein